MAIPYNIREETARYIDRTFFRVATLPDKPPPCVSSPPPPFAPSIVAAGYDLPRGRPEKWKFQYVQASIMLDLSLPTTACSAIPPRMLENALRWPLLPLSSPPFYAFSFFLFYDVPRLESRDSIFLRCLYIYNVCVYVCVWVCARGLVCIQGRGNRGLVSLKESRYNKTYRRTKYFSFFFRPLLRVGILRYFGVLK